MRYLIIFATILLSACQFQAEKKEVSRCDAACKISQARDTSGNLVIKELESTFGSVHVRQTLRQNKEGDYLASSYVWEGLSGKRSSFGTESNMTLSSVQLEKYKAKQYNPLLFEVQEVFYWRCRHGEWRRKYRAGSKETTVSEIRSEWQADSTWKAGVDTLGWHQELTGILNGLGWGKNKEAQY